MDYTKQAVRQKFDTLTEEMRKALLSDHFGVAIHGIAMRNRLMKEQEGGLGRATTWLAMGLVAKDKFAEHIVQKLSIDATRAGMIDQEVKEKVLPKLNEFAYMPDMTDDELDLAYAESAPNPKAAVENLAFLDDKLGAGKPSEPEKPATDWAAPKQAAQPAPDQAPSVPAAEPVQPQQPAPQPPPKYQGKDPYREPLE